MSEKKPADKKPIRDLLQEKDAFLTTSEKFYEYFLRHTRAFVTVAVAAAVIVVAVAFYTKSQKEAEAESTRAYDQAVEMVLDQSDDDLSGVLAALEKVRADYEGRQGSRLASFTLVNLYGSRNDPKALPLAEHLLQTLKPAEIALKPLLLNNLGGLYENAGDWPRSAASYEAILSLSNLDPALKLETLMSLGRVYTAAGQQDEAVRRYQTVVKDFPRSFQSYLANLKVAELKDAPEAYPGVYAEVKGLTPEPEPAPAAETEEKTAPEAAGSNPAAEAATEAPAAAADETPAEPAEETTPAENVESTENAPAE